jgi:hypothetical protein
LHIRLIKSLHFCKQTTTVNLRATKQVFLGKIAFSPQENRKTLHFHEQNEDLGK